MQRWAMVAFARLPRPVRRWLIHVIAPSYSCGAVAVLRRGDGCVLFVDQRHTGGWALPGGLLRRRERSDDAVRREVAEEVGLELDALPVPMAAVDPGARRIDLVYVLDAPAEAPQDTGDAEVRRSAWFPLDELPDVTEPTRYLLRAVRLL